jgi:4'-phosphopantetheinyl transferase EntD
VLDEVLPAAVASAEARDDPADAWLFPAEEALLARAVDKRRREFTTVRHCARAALGELGLPPVPILPGERGAPRWPAGVVGSMTHCAGYRAAAVARAADLLTIGIDAEPDQPLPEGVAEAVALPDELARLRAERPVPNWDRLLFSAKESVYKAWFPLTRRWLDFADARLDLDPAGTFTAHLLVPPPTIAGRPLTGFAGRWLARDGLLVTVIALPHAAGAQR